MSERDSILHIATRTEVRRRDLLKWLGAGLALAEIGCVEQPGETVAPYVRVPPELTPGTAVHYATTMTLGGFGTGVVAETHQARPIKIDGNPAHPATLGGTLPVHQASVLDLYDPQRLTDPRFGLLPASLGRVAAMLAAPPPPLWLVLPSTASPTIAALLERVRARFPGTRLVRGGGPDHRARYLGTQLAFGEPLEVLPAFDRADVVVVLDADPFGTSPQAARWARDWAARRRLAGPSGDPGRMYVAEPAPTPTGTVADHRLPLRAQEVPALAVMLVAELRGRGLSLPRLPDELVSRAAAVIGPAAERWVRAAADDLGRRRAAGIVLAGDRQPAAVHAVARWIDDALGNHGRTVELARPALIDPLGGATLARLAAAIDAGEAGAVVILESNPVYTAPRELDLGRRLRQVPLTVHHTLRPDETSAACQWLVPASHYLEAWGDARAFDGTASIVQPVIRPLHRSLSQVELLATLAGLRTPDGLALVRETWRGVDWRAALSEGVIRGTEAPRVRPRLADPTPAIAAIDAAVRPAERGLELALAVSPAILDGRFAGNAWLQELPHPITKQTWGNAALMSRATMAELGLDDGDVVRLEAAGRRLEAPALAVPGHVDGGVTLELGYGRRTPDMPIADEVGADAFTFLRSDGGTIVRGASATRSGGRARLARTQTSFDPHGREIALAAELSAYRADPDFTAHHRGPQPSMLTPPQPERGLQWAMTIDTMICTGCSSCVVACQAENNIPVVGPEQVRRGREMHWLRIDTYVEDGGHVHQPMACQHCDKAPCEYVCPVNATVHSPDGLNEMVYNRCIGTRFCSNNCPYKVRRFNYLDYHGAPDPTDLQHNPDVTVRARGVMEKCTYCVQRIRRAEHEARVARRPLEPGEVVTACQQACPTGAIQFGAMQHEDTPMVRWRQEPRVYGVLHELGTRPRTLYLAAIRNPHPELDD